MESCLQFTMQCTVQYDIIINSVSVDADTLIIFVYTMLLNVIVRCLSLPEALLGTEC